MSPAQSLSTSSKGNFPTYFIMLRPNPRFFFGFLQMTASWNPSTSLLFEMAASWNSPTSLLFEMAVSWNSPAFFIGDFFQVHSGIGLLLLLQVNFLFVVCFFAFVIGESIMQHRYWNCFDDRLPLVGISKCVRSGQSVTSLDGNIALCIDLS